MGMNNYVKLGFFFRIKNQEESIFSKKILRCENENCDNHLKENMSGNFCTICGGKIEKTIIQKKRMIYPNLYDFFEEKLEGSEIAYRTDNLPENIWVYNFKFEESILKNAIFESSDEEFLIDLTTCDIEETMKAFKEIPKVKDFMEKFHEYYPNNEIKACFGLYNLWM